MTLDTKELLNVISSQIADIINDNLEYYNGIDIVLEEEQMFYDNEERVPGRIYVVVQFLSASIDYGQTAVPIVFQIVSEQNRLELTKNLFYEYAERYNLFWNEDKTMEQVYETPSVVSNFNEIHEGFRTLMTMAGAVLLIENGNNCEINYLGAFQVDKKTISYYKLQDGTYINYTDLYNPNIDDNKLKMALKKNNIGLDSESDFEFVFETNSWKFKKIINGETKEIILDIIDLNEYGISYYNQKAEKDDKIAFKLLDYIDIDFISLNAAASISLDSQAFYSSNGFTKSRAKFGSFSINITTYLFDNEFLNKCLAVYLNDLEEEPMGIDTIFEMSLKFQNMPKKIKKDFRLASFSLQQNKGQIPLVSMTFSE